MIALALIPLYSWADRFAGGGWGAAWFQRRTGLKSRYGAYLAVLIGTALLDLRLLPMAASWCLWRLSAPDVWGGALDSGTPRELVGTTLRACIVLLGTPFVPLVIGRLQLHKPPPYMLLDMAVLIAVVVALSAYYAYERRKHGRDVNHIVEPVRGAAYGVALLIL